MNAGTERLAALQLLDAPRVADIIQQLPDARIGVDWALRDLELHGSTTRLDAAERQLQGALALLGKLRAACHRDGIA